MLGTVRVSPLRVVKAPPSIPSGEYANFTEYSSDPAQAAKLDIVYTARE
jgi:hypothetical protein